MSTLHLQHEVFTRGPQKSSRRGFLRYFIVEELAKDVDGYSFSNFATRLRSETKDEEIRCTGCGKRFGHQMVWVCCFVGLGASFPLVLHGSRFFPHVRPAQNGHGSKPFWYRFGRCTTHFSLQWGLGCALGILTHGQMGQRLSSWFPFCNQKTGGCPQQKHTYPNGLGVPFWSWYPSWLVLQESQEDHQGQFWGPS